MISHELKLIFIHIPRTGGTSVEKALVGKNWWNIDPKTKHLTCVEARQTYRDYWDDYTKFSITRNPWDWLVSLYHSHNQVRAKRGQITWPEYVRHPTMDRHEQHSAIQSEIIGTDMDLVLRFETIQSDFDDLCKRVGRPKTDLPFLVTQSGRQGDEYRHYSSYYDEELEEIVRTRQVMDINRFGYRFEREPRDR